MYNWHLFITAVIQHVYAHKLRYILYMALPLAIPTSTYLAPSSCDRNRPPQSRVARKLIPFVPHCSLVPSPSKFPTLPGFPEPNVLLIRAHPNPLSSIRHSPPWDAPITICIITHIYRLVLLMTHLGASSDPAAPMSMSATGSPPLPPPLGHHEYFLLRSSMPFSWASPSPAPDVLQSPSSGRPALPPLPSLHPPS